MQSLTVMQSLTFNYPHRRFCLLGYSGQNILSSDCGEYDLLGRLAGIACLGILLLMPPCVIFDPTISRLEVSRQARH